MALYFPYCSMCFSSIHALRTISATGLMAQRRAISRSASLSMLLPPFAYHSLHDTLFSRFCKDTLGRLTETRCRSTAGHMICNMYAHMVTNNNNSECKSVRNFLHIKVLLMLSFSGLCQKSRRRRYKVRGDMVDLIGFEPTTPTMRMWCAPSCATSEKNQYYFIVRLTGSNSAFASILFVICGICRRAYRRSPGR